MTNLDPKDRFGRFPHTLPIPFQSHCNRGQCVQGKCCHPSQINYLFPEIISQCNIHLERIQLFSAQMGLTGSVSPFDPLKAHGPVSCHPLEGFCHSLSIHIRQGYCFVTIYLLQGDLVIFRRDYARGCHYFCPACLVIFYCQRMLSFTFTDNLPP